MTTITYGSSITYIGNRPWADVVLEPATPGSPTLKCLVDTGADYLQVNEVDAVSAGVNLVGAALTSVSTAAGTAHGLLLVAGVSVDIEARRVNVDLLVDPTNTTSPPIAGRTVLLAAFDVGFDTTQWHNT